MPIAAIIDEILEEFMKQINTVGKKNKTRNIHGACCSPRNHLIMIWFPIYIYHLEKNALTVLVQLVYITVLFLCK